MALARRRPAASLIALLSIAALFTAASATGKTGQVAVFWGRNKDEGSLREACDAGTYTIVLISFLDVFGKGYYHLDISGHDVSAMNADIKHCQSKNILVFLSIGGFGSGYSVPTPKSAAAVADYLWDAYMLGSNPAVPRPFGDAFVDGIDFFLDSGSSHSYSSGEFYDELARKLYAHNKDYRGRTPVQFTLTPRCAYPPPDRRVQKVLSTGLVGRIFVRFYDDGDCAAFWQREWERWTAGHPEAQIYVGLPASEQKVGYVHPKNLFYGVIPVVQKASNYGGIMIWERFEDKRTNYSGYAITLA